MDKKLSEFFTQDTQKKCGFLSKDGNGDPTVTGLEYDSRNVKPGNLFFALPGLHTDGSLFIKDAVSKGAQVIIHQNDIEYALRREFHDNPLLRDLVFIKVKNSRYAMSSVSASFYDHPSLNLLVTGVTGTEGKSTTVYFIWQLLTMLGKKTGFISTVQKSFGDEVIFNEEHQTTPEAPIVQKHLRQMLDNGCEYAVIEASSHGLSEKTNRLGDVNFCSAVLTNITYDHMEFHGSFEQYRDDKANLFRALDCYIPSIDSTGAVKNFSESFGVINGDDRNFRFFKNATRQKTYLFSSQGRDGDILVEAIESTATGNWYTVRIPALNERLELRDKLPGVYNAGNVLAALLAVSCLLSRPVKEIVPFVKKLIPVKGRMSAIDKGQDFEVIVDFAHTPSSFQAIFPPLRARLDKSGGSIISVFGSAGERDTRKRYTQGKIAAMYSDAVVLTDEDPRGEEPMAILKEIARGVKDAENKTGFTLNKNLFLIPDRPAAIRKALSLAKKGDLVIFLGKGHENSIIYKDHAVPFDEISEVEKALSEI